MKWTVLILLALISSNDPRKIAATNQLKKEAKEAYLENDYELALSKYLVLVDSMENKEDEVKLNLAHSYFHLNDTTGALSNYSDLSTSSNKRIQSVANQQLGVLKKKAGKLNESLEHLKTALKADPTNQGARYDYEVVKKMLENQKEQEQDQQQDNQNQENQEQEDQQQNENEENQEQQGENQENQEQQGENQENQEQQGENQENQEQQNQEQQSEEEGEQQEQQQQEGEEGEEEKSQEQMTKEKLEEMNMSEEKARMILEAMRQNEIKYLQQQKRKATERPNSGKPDW